MIFIRSVWAIIKNSFKLKAQRLIFHFFVSVRGPAMPPSERDAARRFAQYMGFLAAFDFVLSAALLIMCGDQVGAPV